MTTEAVITVDLEAVMEARRELDELIQLLEATIPANPNSPPNQRLQQRLQRSLAEYFKSLADAFPYDQVDRLYYKYVKEQLGAETRDMLDPLLAIFDSKLQTDINGQLATTYISGQTEMITWGKTKAGIPIAYEGPPISQAINWAEKHGAKLVTQMDEETKRRLAKVVSDGIKNKRGVPGLARDIRKDFGNMSTYRSQLIAKTETRMALFQSSHDNMVAMGIDGKEWVLGAGGVTGNCEDCLANAAVGVIPVGQEFPIPEGGIHPGCTCAIAPARLPAITEAMTPADWKAEYKKGTPHWAKDMTPSIFAKEFVKIMQKHLADSVLEIGCGNGRDSILFAKSGLEVTSIDIVPKAVELAKKNAEKDELNIDFRVANVEKLPFNEASFGAVFTLSVLHSTDLGKSLPEVARVLRPEGVAFIYIYGDTQFKDGSKKEDTIAWSDYLTKLKSLDFNLLKSYTEQEDEFDEFGEKHRIFVVLLQKVSE